jgi:molybdate transport system ATP-binding protein
MIRARLKKRFASRQDSAAFTLDIELSTASGVTVLFGPSGAGKTLTLDIIAGFLKADEGRILLDDQILFDAEARVNLPPQQRRCGYVFQNYALFPHLTLRENLEFAAERKPRLDRHRRVNDMLDRFRLGEVAGRKPHELSGGQKQRCSIARALLIEPKLLLLDEPARGLDAPLRAELYNTLRQVRQDFNTPILLVTHDLNECFELGDAMFVFRDGRIAQSGSPRDILTQPASLDVARLLGFFNLLPGEIRHLDPARNLSRVRCGDAELEGPYFPGHLLGDRVTLCLRHEEVRAVPRNGRPGANQIAVDLVRVVERPRTVLLEFSSEMAAEMPRTDFEALRNCREWSLEFPRELLRVL